MARTLFPVILLLLPVSALALQLQPFSLSVSHEYDHPAEKTETRGTAQTGFLRASAEIHGSGRFVSGNQDLHSWSIRWKPLDQLQLLGGSISLSGLPSRVKNMAGPVNSPQFRPLAVSRAAILSPGTTRTTETAGAEFQGTYVDLSIFGNPRQPDTPGSWFQILFTSPRNLPGNTTIQGALYTGYRRHIAKPSDSWFSAEQKATEHPVIFPAAELILSNSHITAGITAMRNISRLYTDTSAIRMDAAISFRQFTFGGRYFRSDTGYTEFDGSPTRIRERCLFASSFTVRIPGTERTTGRIRVLYARDLLSPESPEESMEPDEWAGARISVENPLMTVQGTLVKSETQYQLSAKAILYRLFFKWLRMDLSGKLDLPEGYISSTAWENCQSRLKITATAKQGKHQAKFSLGGSANCRNSESPVAYNLEGGITVSVYAKHFRQILKIEGSLSPRQPAPQGKLTFSLLLH